MHFCGVASASAVRGAAGQLALPLHKALSRARTSEQETHTVDMLSLSLWFCSSVLPSLSGVFTFALRYFIWIMKAGNILYLQSTTLHFQGHKKPLH